MTLQPNNKRPVGWFSPVGLFACLVVPVGVAVVCLIVDLGASAQHSTDLSRAEVLYLLAGILQLVIVIAVAPWWGARRGVDCTIPVSPQRGGESQGEGDRIAPEGRYHPAILVLAMVLATTIALLVVGLLQEEVRVVELLKIQSVVLSVGLFAAGLAGLVRLIIRSEKVAAASVSLLCFLLLASPFWGNAVIHSARDENRGRAVAFVANVTPISACSSAVDFEYFRGHTLYDVSVVADYQHTLPAWWLYSLIVGGAGIVLIAALAAISLSHRERAG